MFNPIYSGVAGDRFDGLEQAYRAVFDFAALFACPQIDPVKIVRDVINRAALPKFDICIISVKSSARSAVRDEWFDNKEIIAPNDPAHVEHHTHWLAQCGFDFYSTDGSAQQRAHSVASLLWGEIGCSHFAKYGCNFIDNDSPQELPFSDENRQNEHRYLVPFRIEYTTSYRVGTAWLDEYSVLSTVTAQLGGDKVAVGIRPNLIK